MYPRLGATSSQATATAVAVAVASGGVNIAADVSAILGIIGGAFSGSSYDATHQQILAWSHTILSDPGFTTAAAQDAWLRLRCWAGDQSVITPANTQELFGTGNVAQGCGCEVDNGCRADAQSAVAIIKQAIPALLTGPLSSAPYTNPVTGQPAPAPANSTSNGGTIFTTLPGGTVVGLPVPASSILTSSIGGVPVEAIAAVGLLLAFALGGRRR